MFTSRKFLSLDPTTRLRHLWRWLKDAENELAAGLWPCSLFAQLKDLQTFLDQLDDPVWTPVRKVFDDFSVADQSAPCKVGLGRTINELHHHIAGLIGREAAEWDLREGLWSRVQMPESCESPKKEGYRRIYLDDLRSPYNVGSIFRTAEVFGFSEIILSPRCPALNHPRLERSAMGCIARVPHRTMEFNELFDESKDGDEPRSFFALELGGTTLSAFAFPKHGTVVLGNEELGVNPAILEQCSTSAGRVSIPMRGSKASLNVSVSFGILAHTWTFA